MPAILALTRYQRLGSSSRVRFYQYFPYLEAKGVEILNTSFFDDEYVRNLYAGHKTSWVTVFDAYRNRLARIMRKKNIDMLWVEKELFPWLPLGFESIFLGRNIPYVVDYDDAVFHRYDMHPNRFFRAFLGKKIYHVMRLASLVIAGNGYIADHAQNAGARRVEILPSVVDVDKYSVKHPEIDDVFKIGWIGAPVTARYLHLVNDALSIINRESSVRLILVGAGNMSPFPDIPTKLLPWSEELERTVNQEFDVGIMPLVDGPFERGKCGYKLIQYMAGGIPVVASPVGVNQQIVEAGVNGFLADSTEEWLSALRTLRDNVQKRQMMGQRGRLEAERLYNLQVTAPRLLELLQSAVKKKTNA